MPRSSGQKLKLLYLMDYLLQYSDAEHPVTVKQLIAELDEPRDGADAYRSLDMAVYSRKVFGMFSGTEERVRMRFANHLVGAVLDRLGQDASIIPDGDGYFTVSADVVVSPQFFAWLCGFGADARLLAPESAVARMKKHIGDISELYR